MQDQDLIELASKIEKIQFYFICYWVVAIVFVILLALYIYYYFPSEMFHTPFKTEIPAQITADTYYKTNPYTNRIINEENNLFYKVRMSD